MIIVWLLAILGIALTAFAITVAILQWLAGKPIQTKYSRTEDELIAQTAALKKQNEILERNRMENWTRPDYFRKE